MSSRSIPTVELSLFFEIKKERKKCISISPAVFFFSQHGLFSIMGVKFWKGFLITGVPFVFFYDAFHFVSPDWI